MGSNKLLVPFFVSLLIPSLLGLISSWILNYFTFLKSDEWVLGLTFFLGTGIILNVIYILRRRAGDFTQMVFVSLILRLILAFLFTFIQSMQETQVFFNFAIHFLCYFVFYTIFEIRFISVIVNKKTVNHEK